MSRDIKRQMKRDCRRFMRSSMIVSCFHQLTGIAAPTVAAWMIGDMANHLLSLDNEAIAAGMPAFLCAVFFQVVVAMLLQLAKNLLLTKQGFAYDGFLMEKYIRLPLHIIQTTDAGSVMERLEEDSGAFCWNQVTLHACPGAVLLCIAVFAYAMTQNGCHILFALTIVFLAALPVVRAAHIGKRQTELKKRVSEHNDVRKQMEQELFDARDFAKAFSLDRYFVHRLRSQFDGFLQKAGAAQYRMDAKTQALDFLCSYGVQMGTVLAGAVLVSLEQLTLGALLSGYLMIPAIRRCCQDIKGWVTEVHDEKKYLERLAFFYEREGESEDSSEALRSLDTDNVTFTYPGSDKAVLRGMDFHMESQDNCRLIGANGSGKTTLMSILAGLYEPQSGTVCHGAAVGRRRKSIALQEQDGTIFSGTVWNNLFLPENKRESAAQLLGEMGMEKPLHYEVRSEGANLSPGEKKKLLLARAVLRDAPFLMLDEPLNHLDEQGKQALVTKLAQRKTGILLISHQDIGLHSLSFREVAVDNGKIS